MTDQVNEAVADRLLAFAAEMRHHADTDEGASRTHRLILQWAHGLETVAAMHSAHPSRGVVGGLPELPKDLLEVLSDLDEQSVAYNQAVSLIYEYARAALQAAALPAESRGVVDADDLFEQYVATLIAKNPDVRKLGERLADWLDEDRFNTINPILLGIAQRLAALPAVPEGCRFFASGPETSFFVAKAHSAEYLIDAAGFDRDEWTVTDLAATPAHDQPEGEG